jgi:hypothetical protein
MDAPRGIGDAHVKGLLLHKDRPTHHLQMKITGPQLTPMGYRTAIEPSFDRPIGYEEVGSSLSYLRTPTRNQVSDPAVRSFGGLNWAKKTSTC